MSRYCRQKGENPNLLEVGGGGAISNQIIDDKRLVGPAIN